MLTRLLSVLLAAAVLVCPLVCVGADSRCEKEPVTASGCCCKHCHSKESSAPGNDTCPGDHRPAEKCCQGVCGGAVIEKRDAQTVTIEFTAFLAPAIVAVSSLEFSEPCTNTAAQVLLPDDGHNPGRVLRCLWQSFLC
jgi:hypothetical protein